MTNKKISFTAIMASVYVLMTLVNPISYGPIQFRISECLCILPFFNKKYRLPIYIGVLIANMMSPLGLIDIVVGLACAFVSYETIMRFTKNIYILCSTYSIVCGLLVGAELLYVYNSPFVLSLLSITASQCIITFLSIIPMKRLYVRFSK